jgi:hypothetical protein
MTKKGFKLTEEHRKKLSLAWDYKKHFTKESRKNLSNSLKGKKKSDKHKANMRKPKLYSHSAWNKNLTKETDERVLKYVNTRLKKGFKQSKESKLKMSVSKKGKDSWNKNIKGGEYLKHYKDNSTWLMKNRTDEMGEKTAKTLKKLHSEGKITIWNKGLYGEKNSGWMNGISFEPYPPTFNKGFKDLIKLRDNFCCLYCGISEQKHIIILNRKLTVHHIDYNKKNTCLQNCTTLCLSCNSKANKNRRDWTEFFQEKLSNLYKYDYKNLNEIEGGIKNEKKKEKFNI